jgi:pimeloyl-ACP methyl ester carboxylesterase
VAEIQTGYAPINGAKLYYEVAGEGHPLVFVHAGIADNTMWSSQFSEFAKHYRVIRFDMRGYGNSEPAEGEYAHREDLAALLDFLKIERTYLIGCSMGGGACMDFTLTQPDKVAALVMVGSGPTGLTLDVPKSPKFAEVETAWNAKDWARVSEIETQIWFDGEGRTPDQVDAQLRAQVIAMNSKAIAHELKELGKNKPPMTPPAAERLGEIKIPVLVVYGDRDSAYIQKAAEHMEHYIQGAKKVLMPNTAHLPNMERPAEFNQIVLDFLQKQ